MWCPCLHNDCTRIHHVLLHQSHQKATWTAVPQGFPQSFLDSMPGRVPQFKLSVDGGGKGLKNLHTGVNVGLGLKLYENKKKNISLDLLLSYAQKLSHIDGQTIVSKPLFGLGGTFRWGRK
ncbi:hypothetical protein TNCV_2924741 [Trichonephila clavipes]|nr:hypothetical protein TNCV_2924741 [Trichonephila clavipes]